MKEKPFGVKNDRSKTFLSRTEAVKSDVTGREKTLCGVRYAECSETQRAVCTVGILFGRTKKANCSCSGVKEKTLCGGGTESRHNRE